MMDEEKAKKFLNAHDKSAIERIEHAHSHASSHPSYVVAQPSTFDGMNARSRHHDRGELLGIVDRLLATTAQLDSWKNDHAKVAKELRFELGATEIALSNARKSLQGYKSLGDLKPWFGGPYAALTLKPEAYDRVFGTHNGVQWGYGSLSKRVTMLEAENKSLRKLADKPMAILDDAQGYYTVTDPFDGNANITVKKLAQRNVYQKEMLDENKEIFGNYRKRDREQSETIQRKNELLLTQQKRIDELEAQIRSVRSYSIAQNTISGLAGALRAAQVDYGDVMVALMDAEERNDVLALRLDKIEELTDIITDVARGEEDVYLANEISNVNAGCNDEDLANEISNVNAGCNDEELKDEAEMDEELGPVGGIYGGPEIIIQGGPPDFSVTSYTYDPITGSIKRKD